MPVSTNHSALFRADSTELSGVPKTELFCEHFLAWSHQFPFSCPACCGPLGSSNWPAPSRSTLPKRAFRQIHRLCFLFSVVQERGKALAHLFHDTPDKGYLLNANSLPSFPAFYLFV